LFVLFIRCDAEGIRNLVSSSLHGIGPTKICPASGSLVMNQGMWHDTRRGLRY
jgi:hypothetical protein